LNTVNVTDMSGMFAYCRNLTTLDLSHFDTSHVMMMDSMFFQSPNLKTIYVSDKFRITTTARKSSNVPFGGCDALVGGNGTKYDGSRSGPLYARIDTPSAPGYFTDISAKPVAYEITAAAPDTDAGTLSVTLTNPDAATLAVSYFDANGKFVSAEFQDAQVDAGTVALALSADAKTARVMLLDSDFRPLCAAYGADVGGAA
ncbi:MAG: BspA family leucine-rich repeat surface protein, partial [Oscillospiraceae bacterium]|nr:BspA family leucine-rich repeat surface protein [Oscillospiraceae bacterium]